MGLESFKTESEPERLKEEDKHSRPELCPVCGEEGRHIRGNEWRCTNPDTDELWWIATDYRIDNAKVQ